MPTTDTIDLTSPDFWLSDPHGTFKGLRQTDPVFLHPGTAYTAGTPFWAVLKHADVARVSRDATTFRSGSGAYLHPTSAQFDDLEGFNNLTTMDDPEHKWMRALVSKGFTPPRIRELEPRIRAHANRILDRAATLETVDFVSDVAAELPMVVIGELIGVPPDDQHLLRAWGVSATSNLDEDDGVGFNDDGVAALTAMFAYLAELEEARRRNPTDDLVSVLLTAEVDGRRLTTAERQAFFVLLWFAGNDTTRYAIAGGMDALSAFPDEKAKLLADPALSTGAAEEILRWSTPITTFRRTAADDVELGGYRVRAGDWVAVVYPSANRDEDVFPDPDRFDVQRSPNPHVTFGGGGAHFCLGARLARLEVRIMFEELLRRFPDIEVSGPAVRWPNIVLPGIQNLPVVLGQDRG